MTEKTTSKWNNYEANRNAHRAPRAVVRNPMVKEKFRKVALDQEYVEKAQAVFV